MLLYNFLIIVSIFVNFEFFYFEYGLMNCLNHGFPHTKIEAVLFIFHSHYRKKMQKNFLSRDYNNDANIKKKY